ncbi:hypothetical protein E8E95_05810 [Pseudomonas sp. BN414]|uniref:hypothetical protein n=1 Tax=Pseudomonas sp. BN414 TaxID=2567888 RepID=UPI002458DB37|nr:hypothetical protein [Pseudomonas sp. BN414]MDH4566189.1 hypothetical protein [Pseudomonas sp. BN414]
MLKFVNNWATSLQALLAADATQMSVPAGKAALLTGLGSGHTYRLTLVDVDIDGVEVGWEIVLVSANDSGLLTVARGQEGTPARAWSAGTPVRARLTAASLDGLSEENYTTADKAKLDGIAEGATVNDTDANLKSRANHTGTQAISTVTGLQAALDKATFSPVVADSTTARIAPLTDAGAYLRFTNTGATAYTVAPQADVAWPSDAEIHVRRAAAANLTLTPGVGVTLNAPSGGTLVMTDRMSVTLKRVAPDVWDVIGHTVAV